MATARLAAESLHFNEAIIGAIKLIKAHLDSIVHDYKDYLPSGKRGRRLETYDEYRSSLQLIDDYLNDLLDELTFAAQARIDEAYEAGVSEDEILSAYDLVDDEIQSQRDFVPGNLLIAREG